MKNLIFSAVVVAALVLCVGPTAEAVTCNASQLSSCAPAILYGSSPSSTCCSKLKEQKPCFCTYLKNPNLRQYVGSPNAKKVVAVCRVSYPKCPKDLGKKN